MSTDLDRALAESLQARADAGSPIDPKPLLDAAVTRGRRLRARRRMAGTALTIVAVAAVAVTTVLIPQQRPDNHPADPLPSGAAPWPAAPEPDPAVTSYQVSDLANLPSAEGQPGAAARPDLVGTDPGLLHFSVDTLAAAADMAEWRSRPGQEFARIARGGLLIEVTLARSARALDTTPSWAVPEVRELSGTSDISMDGRPAVLRTSDLEKGTKLRVYVIDWQPVDGLYARYLVRTEDDLAGGLAILRHVRLDRAKGCIVPYRMDYLPPGATVQECSVSLSMSTPEEILQETRATIADGPRRIEVQASPGSPGMDLSPWLPAKPAGEHTLYEYEEEGERWAVRGGVLDVFFTVDGDKVPEDERIRLAAGLGFAADIQDPGTWSPVR